MTAALIKALSRSEFEVWALCNEDGCYCGQLRKVADHVSVLGIARPRQMQVIEVEKWRHSKLAIIGNIGWFGKAVIKLSRFLKEYDIDIVHSNGGNLSLIAGLAAKKAGIKSVFHRRGLLSKDVPMRLFLGPLGIVAAMCTDQFIGISQSVVDSMPKLWQKRAAVVYDGIDFVGLDAGSDAAWLRRKLNVADDVPLVGIVGSIVPIKGHKNFIEAANILHKHFPQALFVVIGGALESSRDYQKQLCKLVDSYGLYDCFKWMGNVPGANRYLRGLDVLVSATIPPGEGFGLTVVEAVGQGVPVVATSCGASKELIPDGKGGLIIEANQPEKMAQAISKLLSDKELYRRMAQLGRKWSRRNFDIKITAAGVERLYHKLLNT
jgi:glycosyltransferase involved in cell wall biosynthesis